VKFYWAVLGVLCVWRMTHLLQAEDGPWNVVVRLRRSVGNGFWGSLLDCFYCLSLWIAVPVALTAGQGWRERLLLWPALSGAAILLERVTAVRTAPASGIYVEDEEVDDVLRQRTTATHADERAAGIEGDAAGGAADRA
jgi:hypothetical protein